MLCERYKKALIETAALGQPAEEFAPAVREHVSECAACQSLLQAQYQLQSAIGEGLKLRAGVEAPEDLSLRVRRLTAGERRPRVRVLQWAVAGAAVAMVFLVFMVRDSLRRWNTRNAPGELAVTLSSGPGIRPVERNRGANRTRVSKRVRAATTSVVEAEFRPVVSSQQREIVDQLVRSVQRGEFKGEILLSEAQSSETKDLQIAPKRLEVLSVAAEGSAPDTGVSGTSSVTDRRSE